MTKTGILPRRNTNEYLINNPPLVGEIVYSIDTEELWVGNGTIDGGIKITTELLNNLISNCSGNNSLNTTNPTLSSYSVLLNENTSTNISITNYDENLVYTLTNLDTNVITATLQGSNLEILAKNITNDTSKTGTVKISAKENGKNVSDWVNIYVIVENISYVGDSDTTIQVLDIYNDLESNIEYEDIV